MNIVFLLLRQNMIMLLYLLIGYLLFKKKLFTARGSGELGRLLYFSGNLA